MSLKPESPNEGDASRPIAPASPANPAWTPRAILETVIYADDVAAQRDFYERILGLEVASFDPPRHIFFRLNGGMLLVFNPQETSVNEVKIGGKLIPQHGAQGHSHFAFQVTEHQLSELRLRLAECDIVIESEVTWAEGILSVYCRDPAGNSVEFATRSLWYDE